MKLDQTRLAGKIKLDHTLLSSTCIFIVVYAISKQDAAVKQDEANKTKQFKSTSPHRALKNRQNATPHAKHCLSTALIYIRYVFANMPVTTTPSLTTSKR